VPQINAVLLPQGLDRPGRGGLRRQAHQGALAVLQGGPGYQALHPADVEGGLDGIVACTAVLAACQASGHELIVDLSDRHGVACSLVLLEDLVGLLDDEEGLVPEALLRLVSSVCTNVGHAFTPTMCRLGICNLQCRCSMFSGLAFLSR
jgi:hypothetical protein